LGPERYEVPKLAGLTLAEAESALTEVHLVVGEVTHDYSEKVEADKIIKASHTAGDLVPPGTAVDLVISKGRKPIKVVNYAGKSAEEASSALNAAGLVPKFDYAHSDTVPEGVVLSQQPNKGTLHKGDTVTLVV